MKKNCLFKILILFYILCLFSCKKNENSSLIIGTFNINSTLENELSNDSENPEVFAICTTKSTSTLIFSENGDYSLEISQSVKNINFTNTIQNNVTETDIKDYFNQDILIKGKYIVKNNNITLQNKTVVKNDIEYPFDTYQSIDSSVGEKNQTVEFYVDEKELTLFYDTNSITYYRN